MQARRASIEITYEGEDITKDIAADLLSFKYVDNASDTADNIEIELKDDKSKWLNDWFPQKGDKIQATIKTLNWSKDGEGKSLYCGSFIVDEPEYSGPPRKLTISAISTPSNTNFTSTKKSKAWENIKLSAIAQNIADNAGIDLFFDAPSNPIYARKDQSETSDMGFLSDLCKSEGFGFKVTDNKIIIYDEVKYEKQAAVITLDASSSTINSYSFKTSLTNSAYAACRVKYRNAKKGSTFEYLYSIKDDLEDSDKIYEVNKIVNSYAEAERLAEKTLRSVNKKETTATFNVVGDLKYVGTVCIDVTGYGAMNGKYFVDKASHSLPSYNVDLEMHKVLEGY